MKQPTALRLADEHDENGWIAGTRQWCTETSAELRRLHKVNKILLYSMTAIADQTYDSWADGAVAQRIAREAIKKAGEV